MSLGRIERRERPDPAAHDLVAGADLGLALDDHEPGTLANLVVAQLLTGLEPEHDRARPVVRHQDRRVDRASGRLDLREIPGLHGVQPIAPAAAAARWSARTLAIVSPVVDQFPFGPFATNCYVVRADRSAAEAVVVDPSGSATELRLRLASLGARARRSS